MEQAMVSGMDAEIGFMRDALKLREYRQQVLAGNIANADTPNYKAVDIDFAMALRNAEKAQAVALNITSPRHLQGAQDNPLGAQTLYRAAVQPSIDGNTVDMDVERAQFADNAIHYQFVVDRLNGRFKEMLDAIRG